MSGLADPMHIPDKTIMQHEMITMVVELMPLKTVLATIRQVCHR